VSLYGFGQETAGQLVKVARREGQRARGQAGVGFPDFLGWFIEVHTGQTTASHAKGVAQAVNRFVPTSAAGTTQVDATSDLEDSGTDDTVMNLFAAVGSGKWVIYIRVFYSFFLIAAEC
jgi:hypothetical protein